MTRLTDRLTVSAQIDRDDFATLAKVGVAVVIDNRPDHAAAGRLRRATIARLHAEGTSE